MNDSNEMMKLIKEFRPIDDIFFDAITKDKGCCEEIIQTILGDKNIHVKEVIPQATIPNLIGRGVRLDALCKLDDEVLCNIEVQRSNKDNHVKRINYNIACIITNYTPKSTKFKNIPGVIEIYISEFDPLKDGLTKYTIERTCVETGKILDDDILEIMVNTSVDDGSTVAELMKCFMQKNPDNMKFPNIVARVDTIKNTKEGRSDMCELMKQYMDKRLKRERAEGLAEGHIEVAKRMHENNMPIEMISKYTTLTVDELKEILEPAMA